MSYSFKYYAIVYHINESGINEMKKKCIYVFEWIIKSIKQKIMPKLNTIKTPPVRSKSSNWTKKGLSVDEILRHII